MFKIIEPTNWSGESVQAFAGNMNVIGEELWNKMTPTSLRVPAGAAAVRFQETVEDYLRATKDADLEKLKECTNTFLPHLLNYLATAKSVEARELITSILTTVVNKNQAYGNSFDKAVDTFGTPGALIRVFDKYNRLESLMSGTDNNVEDEAVEDTMTDIIGYMLLTVNYK